MLKTSKFTERQIKNWKKYEEIREEGEYNMFDPRAQMGSGMTKSEWIFCMTKYFQLAREVSKGI